MARKVYAVLGLGRFGSSVATTLEQNGCQVLAVDSNEELVQEIAPFVTDAICADVSDKKTMKAIGVGNMDGVVVAIGRDIEASIFATILAKECGASYVLAKASTDVHAEVLQKVGADRIIFPEKDSAIRVGRNLAAGNLLDFIELSDKFSMLEVQAPAKWVGKNLKQLNLREKKINIIGRKLPDGDLKLIVDPDRIITAEDKFILIGGNKELEKEIS